MAPSHVPAALGTGLMLGLGAFMFVIAGGVRAMVRSTHDFVIAGRRIGLGFGVGSVIAVWTWSMAVMMSSAQASPRPSSRSSPPPPGIWAPG